MIIFLYGEDTYRSSQKLKEIKDKFLKEVDESGMNITTLEGAGLKFEEFNQQIKASPFLARKRMIIVKNLISDNKSKDIQKEIVDLLNQGKEKSDNENILVFWESTDHSKSKSKNALWDRLVKEKFAQEFKALSPAQLNSWIKQELESDGGKIEPSAIPVLAATVGNDLWQMKNEITKLVNFRKDEIIRLDDIESMVKAKYDDDIFKLVDALGNKNKKQALKLISDQLNLGSDEIYLLSMLIRQFRIILLIKSLQNTHGNITKEQIAKELKLHPFVAQKALYQSKNFEINKLKQIYNYLLRIDREIKTSNIKPKLQFDILIAKI